MAKQDITAGLAVGDLLEMQGQDVAVGRIGQGRRSFELVNECGGSVGVYTAEQVNGACRLHPQTAANTAYDAARDNLTKYLPERDVAYILNAHVLSEAEYRALAVMTGPEAGALKHHIDMESDCLSHSTRSLNQARQKARNAIRAAYRRVCDAAV